MKMIKAFMRTALLVPALALPAFAAPATPATPAMKSEDTMKSEGTMQMNQSGITKEQHSKYVMLYKDFEVKTLPLRDQLQSKYMELQAIQNLSGTTRADVSKLIEEITTLRSKLRAEKVAFSGILEKEGLGAFGGYQHGQGHGMMGGGMGGAGGCPMMGGGMGHGMKGGTGRGNMGGGMGGGMMGGAGGCSGAAGM